MKIQLSFNVEISRGEIKEIGSMIRSFIRDEKSDHRSSHNRDKKSTQLPKVTEHNQEEKKKTKRFPKSTGGYIEIPQVDRKTNTLPNDSRPKATKEEICAAWNELRKLMGIE